jgi:hypothetical protein
MRMENIFRNHESQHAHSLKSPIASGAESASTPAPNSLPHTPASELQQYLALAQQEPDVRQDLLQKVSAQISSGAYLTSDSAQSTAQAIVESVG